MSRIARVTSGRKTVPSLFGALLLTLSPILIALWLQWTIVAVILILHRVLLLALALAPGAARALTLAPVRPLQPPEWADPSLQVRVADLGIAHAELFMIPLSSPQAFGLGNRKSVQVYLTHGALATLDDDERRAVIDRVLVGAVRGEVSRRMRAVVLVRGVRSVILGRASGLASILALLDRVFALNSALWEGALLPRDRETDYDQVAIREGVDARSLASALRVCATQAPLGRRPAQVRAMDVMSVARTQGVEQGVLSPVRFGRAPVLERASRMDALAGNHRHRHAALTHDLPPLPEIAPPEPAPPEPTPPESSSMGGPSAQETETSPPPEESVPVAIDVSELLGEDAGPKRRLFARRPRRQDPDPDGGGEEWAPSAGVSMAEIAIDAVDLSAPGAPESDIMHLPEPLPPAQLPVVDLSLDETIVLGDDPQEIRGVLVGEDAFAEDVRPRRWRRRRKIDDADAAPRTSPDAADPAFDDQSAAPPAAEENPAAGDAYPEGPPADGGPVPRVLSAEEILSPERKRRRLFSRRRHAEQAEPHVAAEMYDLPPPLLGTETAAPESHGAADDPVGIPLPAVTEDLNPAPQDAPVSQEDPPDVKVRDEAAAPASTRPRRRWPWGRRQSFPADEPRPGIPITPPDIPPPVPVMSTSAPVSDPGEVDADQESVRAISGSDEEAAAAPAVADDGDGQQVSASAPESSAPDSDPDPASDANPDPETAEKPAPMADPQITSVPDIPVDAEADPAPYAAPAEREGQAATPGATPDTVVVLAPLVADDPPPLAANAPAPPLIPLSSPDGPDDGDEAPPVIEPLSVDGPRRIRYSQPLSQRPAVAETEEADEVEEFVPVFRDPLREFFRRGRRR